MSCKPDIKRQKIGLILDSFDLTDLLSNPLKLLRRCPYPPDLSWRQHLCPHPQTLLGI